MPLIELTTVIRAPRERVFDLARSIDAHQHTTSGTAELAVAGGTSGLIAMGDEVTWEARHFGIRQRLTVRVTWQDPGSAFAFELWKPLFGGAVCAVARLMLARVWLRLAENRRSATGATALLVSIASLSLRPVILSPFP